MTSAIRLHSVELSTAGTWNWSIAIEQKYKHCRIPANEHKKKISNVGSDKGVHQAGMFVACEERRWGLC